MMFLNRNRFSISFFASYRRSRSKKKLFFFYFLLAHGAAHDEIEDGSRRTCLKFVKSLWCKLQFSKQHNKGKHWRRTTWRSCWRRKKFSAKSLRAKFQRLFLSVSFLGSRVGKIFKSTTGKKSKAVSQEYLLLFVAFLLSPSCAKEKLPYNISLQYTWISLSKKAILRWSEGWEGVLKMPVPLGTLSLSRERNFNIINL